MLALDQLKTIVWLFDIKQQRIVWANKQALKWWESDSLAELTSRDFGADASEAILQKQREYEEGFKQGQSFFELWQFWPKGIEKKAFCQFCGVLQDNGSFLMLVEANPANLYQDFLSDLSSAMFASYKPTGIFLSANPIFVSEFADKKQDLLGLVHQPNDAIELMQQLKLCERVEIDLKLNAISGPTWYHITATHAITPQNEATYLLHLHNINDRKERELQLLENAEQDMLTGLLNRRGLSDRLVDCVIAQKPFCIFYIDLDGFKMINDSLGHAVGDQLLCEASNRLADIDPDNSYVCRFGGDEFIFVSFQNSTPNSAGVSLTSDCEKYKEIANQLVDVVSAPYSDKSENMLIISASVGFASYPEDSGDYVQLIRFADAAMYQSKAQGKKQWTQYQSGMETDILKRSLLAQELSSAIEKQQLHLHYQAIMNTSNGTIDSFEALLRYQNDKLGFVPPPEVIGVAQDIGILGDIENWIVQRAIRDLPKLREYTNSQACIAVNISGKHVSHPDLPNFCIQQLEANKLQPKDLIIEITESVLIDKISTGNNPLNRIAETGIRLSIDDFGTGYSSLAYLHLIKATTVKIDRAITESSLASPRTLKAIHNLVISLDMVTLIEGIETQEQADVANQVGIHLHQGYKYARPQPLSYFKNRQK
jgi:diguanylate cyclase (GGDEF)-like protein